MGAVVQLNDYRPLIRLEVGKKIRGQYNLFKRLPDGTKIFFEEPITIENGSKHHVAVIRAGDGNVFLMFAENYCWPDVLERDLWWKVLG